ncbi:MAG: sarcosine oxidase subunit gamma SoxG [Desulfobacterales bacterium]|jgi:hypothetical protein
MAVEIMRRSPVTFSGKPFKTELRDHWTVVLEYEDQGNGPWVVDVSHRMRWDLQDSDITRHRPFGLNMPDTPGRCAFENGVLINRMNQTQASIWHLSGEKRSLPDDPAFTDVTDATVFLALLGRETFSITEKLSALEFVDPTKEPPFLLQGPFAHVPCQIVVLGKTPERAAIVLTCSRGYARDMVAAILEAGKEFELQPAGEGVFSDWVSKRSA